MGAVYIDCRFDLKAFWEVFGKLFLRRIDVELFINGEKMKQAIKTFNQEYERRKREEKKNENFVRNTKGGRTKKRMKLANSYEENELHQLMRDHYKTIKYLPQRYWPTSLKN